MRDPQDWNRPVLAGTAILLLLGGAARIHGQEEARDVLLNVRQGVMDTLERLPRYVCTQTIERSRFDPDNAWYAPGKRRSCDALVAEANRPAWKRRLTSSDRLRLDVAVSHIRPGLDSEMHSWAGEDRFSDRDLLEFVHEGAISTGSFSSMLAAIFGGAAASFSYNGDRTVGGRQLVEFGFRVPMEKSQYSYVVGTRGERQMTVAYGGTILADPVASDLVSLVVRASHLPAESGSCELTQTLSYSRVRLHGADFFLPAEVRVSALHADGTEAENLIRYSGCHEFQGQSKVRFESLADEGSPGTGEAAPTSSLPLPPGLPLKLVFTERIDTATAAAGDPIKAKLKKAVRDRAAKVLVPEGTEVTGRIAKIAHFYGGGGQQASLVIAVRLETIDLGGTAYPLRARFEGGDGRFAKPSSGLQRHIEIGPLDRSVDSGDGIFEFWDAKPNYVVGSGLESTWWTLAP